jgi:hypothetical protein
MSILVRCQNCGKNLKTPAEFAGRLGECPFCGRTVEIPGASTAGTAASSAAAADSPVQGLHGASTTIEHFLDPPPAQQNHAVAAAADTKNVIWQRMFEALLDPRSIQWMLTIGGGLCVLGLIVWLVSLGIFEDPRVLAAALGAGTLVILGAGWFVALRTRFRIAGQALTFLGCVVAPLNLWFYHTQNLVTVDGHIWVGGVACCLLYAVTVVELRDGIFMYAF